MTTRHVDGASPLLLGQRLARRAQAGTLDDVLGTEVFKEIRLLGPPGDGAHLIAQFGQHRHRHAAHATRRPGHHHRAGCGPRALDGKIPIGGVGIDDAGLVVDDDDPQVQRIQRGKRCFLYRGILTV